MSWLDGPLTTVALCWRVERRDGIGFGLTTHDRDLVIGGNRYRAAPGMLPSAIRRGDPMEADTTDVAGALHSGAIAEVDLVGGRWDGARVAIFAVDWTDPDPDQRVELGGGVLGAVELANGGFTAELRGAGVRLDAPGCEVTSPECRAELGDRRCRVAMADRSCVTRVVWAEDEQLSVQATPVLPDAWSGGRLRWLDGANSGLEDLIVVGETSRLTLAGLPRFAVTAGDRVELIEGCDKSLATCAGRFNNAANFRGEPFLPGMDLLTRYPPA